MPGVVSTSIWGKLDERGLGTTYDGTAFESSLAKSREMTRQVGQAGMPVEKVCNAVRQALEVKRPRVRYVVPIKRISLRSVIPWIPARWLDRIIARRLGLRS